MLQLWSSQCTFTYFPCVITSYSHDHVWENRWLVAWMFLFLCLICILLFWKWKNVWFNQLHLLPIHRLSWLKWYPTSANWSVIFQLSYFPEKQLVHNDGIVEVIPFWEHLPLRPARPVLWQLVIFPNRISKANRSLNWRFFSNFFTNISPGPSDFCAVVKL